MRVMGREVRWSALKFPCRDRGIMKCPIEGKIDMNIPREAIDGFALPEETELETRGVG